MADRTVSVTLETVGTHGLVRCRRNVARRTPRRRAGDGRLHTGQEGSIGSVVLASGSAEHSRPGDTRMVPTIDAADIETHQLARTQGPVSRPGQGKARTLAHQDPNAARIGASLHDFRPIRGGRLALGGPASNGLNHLVERLLGDAQSALQAFDLERCLHTARGREVVGAAYDLEGNEPFVHAFPLEGGKPAHLDADRPTSYTQQTEG